MHLFVPVSFLKLLWTFSLLVVVTGQSMAAPSNKTNQIIDTTNQSQARTNTEYLLVKALDKTKFLQKQYGKFFTYGAALFPDGSVKFVWYGKPDGGVTHSNNAIPFIRRVLQKQAESGRIIASAVVYELHRDNTEQAQLNVELEYYSGLAEVFSAEFNIKDNNQIHWGRNVRKNYEGRIFPPLSKPNKDS